MHTPTLSEIVDMIQARLDDIDDEAQDVLVLVAARDALSECAESEDRMKRLESMITTIEERVS